MAHENCIPTHCDCIKDDLYDLAILKEFISKILKSKKKIAPMPSPRLSEILEELK